MGRGFVRLRPLTPTEDNHVRLTYALAAGLCLAVASPAITAAESKPSCSGHGTTIDFFDTPKEAAAEAKKDGKLVMVLHVSGNFEDPRFT
jgi:hypothetical protein